MTRSNSATRSSAELGLLERLGHLVRIGRGEVAADGEQVPLHRLEQRVEQLDRRGGARHADGRVELVHVAVGGDARVVLRDAAAAEEAGLAVVAGPGVDLHAGE